MEEIKVNTPADNTVKAEAPKIAPEKKEKKRLFPILFYSSLALNALLLFLFIKEKNRANQIIVEKQTVVVERDNVKTDLLQLQEDYSLLQTSDKALQGELEEKKAQIAQLIVEAEKHKGDAYYISKLKKEGETLRKIMQGYIHTIDSLNTTNKMLYKENIKVRTDLLSEKEKGSLLVKEKEDLQNVINTGAILKASSFKASGIILKSGGKKEVDTKKARKTDKIKASFTIVENSLAKKGNKDIFMRVITPEGKELARAIDDANSFSFNGSKGFFCARQSINYDNKEMTIALYAEQKVGFVAGKYIIEAYCEGSMLGQAQLILE